MQDEGDPRALGGWEAGVAAAATVWGFVAELPRKCLSANPGPPGSHFRPPQALLARAGRHAEVQAGRQT